MAATNTVKKRKIIIGGKEYQMPQKMTTLAYMRYIKLRDEIMETEKQQRLYNYNQFVEMMSRKILQVASDAGNDAAVRRG